ncbi:RING-H2 finger protein ATL46 [Sesamum angolense]|uniref:RING-type E3 ubiquitin transferase n=1 Tax=Sesamum angolense TaxID=2727404 RepID=A0AAE1WJI1_9LAMI|nr:RING-H2 finger protein ATL46 [Sesamum angolense]
MGRISPVILLVIVILAIGFFILGLLQLLIRCLFKRPSFSSISQSNRLTDASGSHTFQRQLQQLFRLHDSGLDQALIDALPVFYYKDIVGLKEPFDCAVCLCEFSDGDKLKFLPNCSHAFHIHCIETWLLSNSTCPLCRSFIGSWNPMESPLFNFDDAMEQWSLSCPDGGNESSSSSRWPGISQESAGPAGIFSVRLGKFRSSNEGVESEDKRKNEVSSCGSSIDARRCYSMGAFQYIVADANLQVALSRQNGVSVKAKAQYTKEQFANNTDMDTKKINPRSRGDSFSVSKIWLWSKKGKFPSSSDTNENIAPPMPKGSNLV